ncbi:MAG: hypothetical protein AB1560_02510 [Pseudomonadota bacterium]
MAPASENRRYAALFLSALFLFTVPATALSASIAMDVNQEQVRQWNRFAQMLVELHEKAVAQHEIRESEETGRHGGEFAGRFSYREVSYHDAKSGRLLSRIRRGTDSPDKIQMIDVFIYDPSGRVTRDYTAIYLPWARNAPIRTYINLHQYQDGLHGFRQFDASGNRLYEQCRGKYSGGQVDLSLEDYRIDENITATTAYRACFGKLPATADNYLTPH